jgi:hypothetical protein
MPSEQADTVPGGFGVVTKFDRADLVGVDIAYRPPAMPVSAV